MAEDQEFTLPPLEERPLVTFALFAYNQEKYIREAVEGAFAQTYEPLEIILSDDCSTDRTFEIMEEMVSNYVGPHKIKLRKNSENLGTLAHVITVGKISEGELLILAAGDDVSAPDRAIALGNLYRATKAMALHSASIVCNQELKNGAYTKPSQYIPTKKSIILNKKQKHIYGATSAYQRDLFDLLPVPAERILIEDYPLAVAAQSLGGDVAFTDQPLVLIRIHDQNTWGQNINNLQATIEEEERKMMRKMRLKHQALEYVLYLHTTKSILPFDFKTKIDLKKLRKQITLSLYRSKWDSINFIQKIHFLLLAITERETRSAIPRLFTMHIFIILKKYIT